MKRQRGKKDDFLSLGGTLATIHLLEHVQNYCLKKYSNRNPKMAG